MQITLTPEQQGTLEQMRGEREQITDTLLNVKNQIAGLQATETHLEGARAMITQKINKFFEEVKAAHVPTPAPEPSTQTPEVSKPNPFDALTTAVATEVAPKQLELVSSNGSPVPERKKRNKQ